MRNPNKSPDHWAPPSVLAKNSGKYKMSICEVFSLLSPKLFKLRIWCWVVPKCLLLSNIGRGRHLSFHWRTLRLDHSRKSKVAWKYREGFEPRLFWEFTLLCIRHTLWPRKESRQLRPCELSLDVSRMLEAATWNLRHFLSLPTALRPYRVIPDGQAPLALNIWLEIEIARARQDSYYLWEMTNETEAEVGPLE